MGNLPTLQRMRRPASMRDRIHDRLRAGILSGELRPGSPVIEAEIAARLGASRTPVREALRRLESEGLLEPRGGRGTVVREIRPDDVVCIFEIRESLESLAARRAARRMSAAQLAKLSALVERMRDAVDDPSELERVDTAFHDLILEAGDGPRLKRMLSDLRAEIVSWRYLSLGDAGRRRATIVEHEGILAALQARDESLAAERSAAHIGSVREAVLARSAAR